MQENDSDDAMPGQDSFVDVICNMVGILIVLVMILGVRSSGARSVAPAASATSARGDAEAPESVKADVAKHSIVGSCKDLDDAIHRLDEMAVQSALTEARRDQLATVLAAVQEEIAQRRSKLGAEGQRQFDVQAKIAAGNIKLHELMQQQVRIAAEPPKVEEIECVPTALGKSITGDVIQVRLAHGNLAVIPVEELAKQGIDQSRDYLRDELRRRNRAVGRVGPIDGFFMQIEIVLSEESQSSLNSNQPRLRQAMFFHPTSDDIGEPIDQAIQPDSAFMRILSANRATKQAVLVSVYPNSYKELRTLKRVLWEMNFPLAIFPKAYGEAIGVSINGGTPTRAQ